MRFDLKDKFSNIYEKNLWGEPNSIPGRKNQKFYSGGGTDPENDLNNQYVNLIQSYVSRPDVNTVIEIGCGDWEVSSRIDWSSVKYTGYDVVPDLLDYNRSTYGSNNIEFVCDDPIGTNVIKADLLIMKDVIQHLPASFSKKFIKSIPTNFKYNIVTNDMGLTNLEIEFGGYCANNFNAGPFFMNYEVLIHWKQKYAEAGDKWTIAFSK
jgi:hypothetical protein